MISSNHFWYGCLFVVLENILNCKSVSYKFSVNFMVFSFWKPGLFPLNGFAQTPNHFHMILSIDLIIFKIFQVHIISACNRRIGTKCACFIISFKTVKLIQWNTTVGSILQNYWSPFCPLSGLSGRHTRGIYVVRWTLPLTISNTFMFVNSTWWNVRTCFSFFFFASAEFVSAVTSSRTCSWWTWSAFRETRTPLGPVSPLKLLWKCCEAMFRWTWSFVIATF